MNDSTRSKFLYIVIIALLVINAGTLILLWTKSPGRDRMMPPPPFQQDGRPPLHIVFEKELGLTKEQSDKYAVMRKEHQDNIRKLQDELRDMKNSLFGKIKTDMPENELDTAAQKIGVKEAEKDKITYQHFRDFRNILNDEQKKKFDDMIVDVLTPGPPPPPPPR